MVFIDKTRDGVVSAVTDVEVRDVVCGQNHVVSVCTGSCLAFSRHFIECIVYCYWVICIDGSVMVKPLACNSRGRGIESAIPLPGSDLVQVLTHVCLSYQAA